MSAPKCSSCGVNDAASGGLCTPCQKATDRLIGDAKKSGGKGGKS